MREYIGLCSHCGNEVFCLDGFFNGTLTDDKNIVCFDCQSSQNVKKKEE